MLKYALLFFLVILSSTVDACMMAGRPEDEVGRDAVEKELATLSDSDIVFIGAVVGVIPQKRPPPPVDQYAPLSFAVPIFKVVKPIQNSVEGDLYEGRIHAYTCSGSSSPEFGEIWLFHSTDSTIKETWLRTPERNVTSKEDALIKKRFNYDLASTEISTFVAPNVFIRFAAENYPRASAVVVFGVTVVFSAMYWVQRRLRRRTKNG